MNRHPGGEAHTLHMLELAGLGYAVENARSEVKAAADEVIGPMREDSVLGVIRQWL